MVDDENRCAAIVSANDVGFTGQLRTSGW